MNAMQALHKSLKDKQVLKPLVIEEEEHTTKPLLMKWGKHFETSEIVDIRDLVSEDSSEEEKEEEEYSDETDAELKFLFTLQPQLKKYL